jgi:hypothetical protein
MKKLVQDHGATLTGTVNPGNAITDGYFEYGVDTSYGAQVSFDNVPTGGDPVPVTVKVTGLSAQTDYHFRMYVENSVGFDNSEDNMFTTPADSVVAVAPIAVIGDAVDIY